jgi:hypothetical protein
MRTKDEIQQELRREEILKNNYEHMLRAVTGPYGANELTLNAIRRDIDRCEAKIEAYEWALKIIPF